MQAGQLFSQHFLTDGIRTTDAYQRLASDPSSARDFAQRLLVDPFVHERTVSDGDPGEDVERLGGQAHLEEFPSVAHPWRRAMVTRTEK